MYSNIRENRLSGLDADITINGETVPNTIPTNLKRTDYKNGIEILDKNNDPTGEFEQIPFEVDVYQEILDQEKAGKIKIKWRTVEEKTAEANVKLVQTADQFVISEMGIADKAIDAHDEGASRVISTKTKWINYKNKLRDYVQLVSGVRKIIISKPTRPS